MKTNSTSVSTNQELFSLFVDLYNNLQFSSGFDLIHFNVKRFLPWVFQVQCDPVMKLSALSVI